MEDLIEMVRRLAQGARAIDLFPPPATRKRREIVLVTLSRDHASDAEALASDWRAVGKDLFEAAVRERVGKLGNRNALNDWLKHHDLSKHEAQWPAAAKQLVNANGIKGAIRQECEKQGNAAAGGELAILDQALSEVYAADGVSTSPAKCRAGSIKAQKKRA